jgi:DNA replication protein DnaC
MPTNYLECLEKLVSDIKNGKYEIENIKIRRDAVPVLIIDDWGTYKPSDIVSWCIKLKIGA